MKTEDDDNINMLREINRHGPVEIEHSNLEAVSAPVVASPIETSQTDDHKHCAHGRENNAHGNSHDHNRPGNRLAGRKNYCIIIYTVFTCLSCLYLQTQYLNVLINDIKANLMSYIAYFDVLMCLWSYCQTIAINSHVGKVKIKEDSARVVNLKQCEQCNYWKGPRVSHCSSCGKCIYKLDHHCMWTQTCIGYCNQRPFYLFTFYMTIGVFQFWYSSIRAFLLLSGNCHFFDTFEPGIYILWIITCISAGCVGLMIVGLAFGHSLMICSNFTTLDSIKSKRACPIPFFEFRAYQNDPNNVNIWDRGEIQNLKLVFGDNILTCWLPFGRQIQNQFLFQPATPPASQQAQQKRIISVSTAEIRRQLKGQTIQVGDRTIQL